MKAMVYYGARNVRVENVAEPEVKPGTVKIKVKYAGDRVVVENFWGCGECIYCKEGEYYACQHLEAYGLQHPGGFAEYVVVREDKLFLIPDQSSYEIAALIEATSVAMQAVKSSPIKIGDKVAVFGAGPLGSPIAQCAKAAGASQIIVIEKQEKRRQLALEMGADYVIDPNKEDPVKKIHELTDDGVDVAYDAAGVQDTFVDAFDSVKPKGELMVAAVFAESVSYLPFLQQKGVKKINTTRGNYNMFPKVIDLLVKGSFFSGPDYYESNYLRSN
jgi:(R,R)-butanediol dehydrogenase / meso-butanediol dehydrogenase / diacetyl reductase